MSLKRSCTFYRRTHKTLYLHCWRDCHSRRWRACWCRCFQSSSRTQSRSHSLRRPMLKQVVEAHSRDDRHGDPHHVILVGLGVLPLQFVAAVLIELEVKTLSAYCWIACTPDACGSTGSAASVLQCQRQHLFFHSELETVVYALHPLYTFQINYFQQGWNSIYFLPKHFSSFSKNDINIQHVFVNFIGKSQKVNTNVSRLLLIITDCQKKLQELQIKIQHYFVTFGKNKIRIVRIRVSEHFEKNVQCARI